MPQRASNRDIGSTVGRMVFGGQSNKRIQSALGRVDQGRMKAALTSKGLGNVTNKEIAKVLSGEDRSGMSQSKLNKVVEALQDVGIALGKKSASSMVLQASKDAQMAANPGMTAEAVKNRMKGVARERREEADQAAAKKEEAMGILDRQRGDMGRANKRGATITVANNESDDTSIRSVRNQIREDLHLRPKLVIIRPKKKDDENIGFQA